MIPSLDVLAVAARTLLDESPGEDAERAATKALWQLGRGVEIIQIGDAFLIPSGTQAGMVYRVTAEHCDCLSRGPCWHRAAVVIVEEARKRQGALRPSYADAMAEIEELYA